MSTGIDEDLLSTFQLWLSKQHDVGAVAARLVKLGMDPDGVEAIRLMYEEEKKKIRVITLDDPDLSKSEAADELWYVGPASPSPSWDHLYGRLQESLPSQAVTSIALSSTEVVALCANPALPIRKKGLVMGYVQSGKTANYASVIAKAGDAGYRFVIVLAGMHNNLRRQTQVRLEDDLGTKNWFTLTTKDNDFGMEQKGAALFAGKQNVLAVVKKNSFRLQRLLDWMKDCGSALDNTPVLLLDDEADQATPNTADGESQSKINELIRGIWRQVRRGTYVGYTATPFANVFMDPTDDEELYPSDFIRTLPMSPDYFGAERIFGRQSLDDDDEPDDGLDMVRTIPAEDAALLKVPAKQKEEWDANIVPSLDSALRWFVIATAVRRARGQRKHSSMLVHFTHFVAPHRAMADEISGWCELERRAVAAGDVAAYEKLWESERDRVLDVGEPATPDWDRIALRLNEVFAELRVIVDNGAADKEDRLDYGVVDEFGNPVIQTAIVVGGGTLSRGLTLEGLVVSYFTRTSNTYDTLLQMGRWFGYRPGYQDLPRLWMSQELQDDFQYLALVEEDLRRDVRSLVNQQLSPSQIGVRVRSHPGRLQITGKAKMQHADKVQVSFSGQMQQIFILHETDESVLRGNLAATRSLISRVGPDSFTAVGGPRAGNLLARDVRHDLVADFLTSYVGHPNQETLNKDLVLQWFAKAAPDPLWNVGLISPREGRDVDLGFSTPLHLSIRRPKLNPGVGEANIKGLVSQPHTVMDIEAKPVVGNSGVVDWRAHRARHLPERPLLLVYPIDGQSDAPDATFKTRRPMQAPDGLHLVGYAICFPTVQGGAISVNAEYFAVDTGWVQDVLDETFEDTEGDGGGVL